MKMLGRRQRTVAQWRNYEDRRLKHLIRRKLGMLIGKLSIDLGYEKTAQYCGVTVDKCRYWRKKYQDPSFHSGSWGGFRGYKYGEEGEALLHQLVWKIFDLYPDGSLGDYTNIIQELGVTDITRWKVGEIFRTWNWSWKIPSRTQIRKYTPENILYYINWVKQCTRLNWYKAKFLDESHFVDKDLYKRRVVGPRNTASHRIRPGRLDDSFSLTLLLDLAHPKVPFYFNVRYKSNTEWDYYHTLVEAIQTGHLETGDILIVDNASVHFGQGSAEEIVTLLNEHGIHLLFLPKYSPELNPCELAFAQMKAYIRGHRSPSVSLRELIIEALLNLPYPCLCHYYEKCTSLYYRYILHDEIEEETSDEDGWWLQVEDESEEEASDDDEWSLSDSEEGSEEERSNAEDEWYRAFDAEDDYIDSTEEDENESAEIMTCN
jgi:transposase